MLKFKTDGQELFYLDGGDVIVGDTIRYLEAEFDLSDDWKSFPEVTAYFKCGAAINSIILIGGKIKAEDNLALAPGVWSVYLRAYELEGEEIKRQITSSTVKINVLSHGKFTGREFVPENADAYEKRMTEMRNHLVFEEYNPSKKYVKGNKVSYEGSSYVLTADSATGTNPTDGESWLLIAQKGNDGTRIFEFPFKGYGAEVGETYQFGGLSGLEDFYELTIPDIDSWREGDYFISEDGKMLIIEDMLKSYGVVRFITVRCLADIKGKDAVVDTVLNAESENAIANKEVWAWFDIFAKTSEDTARQTARTDLSNVSDEDFKAKAESAGVGGDAGLADEKNFMVFKGVVSELPDDAEEGQVYKRYGYITEYVGWAFESYDNTFKIYPDRIEFGTCTDIFAEVSNYLSKENGAMVNLKHHNYDTGEMHEINATKAENNILYGTTDVKNNYVVGSGTMEFIREGVVNKTYVRFNAEWVEL